MDTLLLPAVVKDDVKASRYTNEKLMEGFQSAPRTIVTTRNVLKVENTFDHEWDVIIPLDKGQITFRVGDFGQVDGPAVLNFIRLNPQLVWSGADSRPSEAGLLALVKIALLSTAARNRSDWSMHQAN